MNIKTLTHTEHLPTAVRASINQLKERFAQQRAELLDRITDLEGKISNRDLLISHLQSQLDLAGYSHCRENQGR